MAATNGAKNGANKRKGFQNDTGGLHFSGDKKLKAPEAEGKSAQAKLEKLTQEIASEHFEQAIPDSLKPFAGAQPKFLPKPEIATAEETWKKTRVASQTIASTIALASGVTVVFAQDASKSRHCKALLESASDAKDVQDQAIKGGTIVGMATDWLHTLADDEMAPYPLDSANDRLLIYVGTPGKYATMCIRSDRGAFDKKYQANKLIVLCKGVCMLPIGTQEENIMGIDENAVLEEVCLALKKKGAVGWAFAANTKAAYMQKAFGYPQARAMPKNLEFPEASVGGFDCLAEYIKFTNQVKLAKPEMTVKNYYDTGLTVSVMMGTIVNKAVSLLTDGDGLAMLRDASIGHIISKLNQVTAVEPLSKTKSIYNFFIGDGACRLNGGAELFMHLMEGYKTDSLTNLFIFNNKVWAIEDNLVAEEEKEHVLFNTDFYDTIAEHGRVCICENELELRETLSYLSAMSNKFVAGEASSGMHLVVVRGLNMKLPPVIGDIEPIRKSQEMQFMRSVLGSFAKGCEQRVPIYGCSAFEYIQYLHIFMDEMPEGKKYQYVCGRTDIQAAHMCGFQQPEGKCVLFINDVYGVNSLGESLRFVLSGFGGKQLLVMIWHPSVLKVIDNFHLHRPPMVWPSLGTSLAKYYVRNESDALFVDFESAGPNGHGVTQKVLDALEASTPLVMVNMMPEQECNCIHLDTRVKVRPA
eukprot:CAMPEP_0197649312 /NCGR_PEP_ID=MMETSP1338-20131121/28278_1 /TAXON_ID=43686 ORGANISM="Pelagodinium beii, Strain RCC1491" /NCGR_SAMPLE_ID=MMETSP1338 /ASSEMBLY_ACC=CAM_ASM_000754 /LENGTH=696 /DNA_ID=CAMNT_0043223469 /DNA_START=46 /DNA_END=2136 /DNA_ORIENTATION=-